MPNKIVRLVCLILTLAFPASLLCAETHAAMVFATGTASLNGAALPRSTAVFAGDVLETSKDSTIIINVNGSTIQVGATSSVQFQGDAINLNSGAAQVTTHSGMRVQANNFIIAPNRSVAKYQVTRVPGKVMVAALNGSISVLNGNTSDVLSAGDTRTYTESQQDDKEERKRDKAGAVIFTSDKTLFTIGATALGTGGVLAWWMLRDGRKPLSNQLP